MVQFYKVLITL